MLGAFACAIYLHAGCGAPLTVARSAADDDELGLQRLRSLAVVEDRPALAGLVPFAEKFLDAAPDHRVWGSDWPHSLTTTEAPNEGDLIDLLYSYGDEALLRTVLVDNPSRLCGFSSAD